MLLNRVAWGLGIAFYVYVSTESALLTIFAFSVVAGGHLFKAYWRSVSEKSDA